MPKKYISTKVYVRIRPYAKDGYHGQQKVKANKGVKVSSENKRIANFEDKSITIVDDGTSYTKKFDYPEKVIKPENDQEGAFNLSGMPERIQKFINGHDCTAIAFGQTGSGKTHTMFGPPTLAQEIRAAQLSEIDLDSASGFPEDWGLFARTILTCMSKMGNGGPESRNGGSASTHTTLFTASVIELYMMQVFDLLNKKKQVPTTKFSGGDFDFGGIVEMPIATPADVAKLAQIVMTERRSSSTNVNDTSSRSHCIATLNVISVDTLQSGNEKVRRNSFTFSDLSGSERVSKTGFEKSQLQGMEGIGINWELHALGITIDKIVEQNKKNRASGSTKKAIKNNDSLLARVLATSIDGRSLCYLMVCLSQSDNNGNESYCSLNFGSRMAKLLTPEPEPAPWENLKAKVKSLKKQLKEQQEAIGKIPESSPYYARRSAKIGQITAELEFLTKYEISS